MHRFRDRQEAGQELADALAEWKGHEDLLVLALPRGGVPVAAEVAERLGAVLDVLVVRKLGLPGHEELAMGAVASGGILVRNDDVLRSSGVDRATVDQVVHHEAAEVARREHTFRGDRAPPEITGRLVILVDDGLATGATMRAAVAAVRSQHARSVIVAVPVGAPEVCAELGRLADEVVCLLRPHDLWAVGRWYDNFDQTSDREVVDILHRHRL
jgi:putative phosphoribosyl transferase